MTLRVIYVLVHFSHSENFDWGPMMALRVSNHLKVL